MNVLCICYEYPPIGGGGAPACQGICESIVRQGHHVDVVTSGMHDLGKNEVRCGVHIHRVRCLRRHQHYSNTLELLTGLLPAYRAAMRLTRGRRYDVIHCHFAVPSGLVARAVARRTKLPYVITAHGSDIPGYNPDRFNFVHGLISPTWRSIMQEAAVVNTPSIYLRDLLRSQLDVPVEVVPYGFSPPPDPGVERKDRVLVVTRMFERKGVQHVIDALHDVDTHWRLCIVGDGPYLPTLKAQAARLGVDAEFLGYVRGPELVKLYHSAKVFALPSSSDNFPVVLLEAMAAGCAVVTTSGTGCAEVVGEAGVTVEPGNQPQLRGALLGLIGDAERVRHLGTLAQRRVRRFHWDRIGGEYKRLYDAATAPANAAEPAAAPPTPIPPPAPARHAAGDGAHVQPQLRALRRRGDPERAQSDLPALGAADLRRRLDRRLDESDPCRGHRRPAGPRLREAKRRAGVGVEHPLAPRPRRGALPARQRRPLRAGQTRHHRRRVPASAGGRAHRPSAPRHLRPRRARAGHPVHDPDGAGLDRRPADPPRRAVALPAHQRAHPSAARPPRRCSRWTRAASAPGPTACSSRPGPC